MFPRIALLILMAAATTGSAMAQLPGSRSISGRLVAEYESLQCGIACEVRLETSGLQLIDIVHPDSQGNFQFQDVPPGTYFIRANLEGFEEVVTQVQVNGMVQSRALIILTRKPKLSEGGNSAMIDVSQFLDQYPSKAVSLYKKAVSNEKKGNTEEAIRQMEEAIAIAPNFFNAYNDLGVLYRKAGRDEDAETAFVRASSLNPNSVEPLLNLGSLYIDSNRATEAVEVSEQAVKRNNTSGPALFNLGLALYRISMLDRAEDTLKRALSLAPKMFQIRLALANVYLKQQRYDSLLDQLDSYLAENPEGDQKAEVEAMREQILKAGNGAAQ
jgi:tetratricopeptide (TPR) repeat protein